MNKPTIFFSHSSKDQELLLPFKNQLEDFTSGVLDIFMSSDGQSIPFGRNWIHKIEEGLNNAQIMFVFITENSINTAWIYFEAGYAYSKGIKVIPVGIGVNIGELKPPLNLLQGFNITTGESLNNFIKIINDEFGLHFKEEFTNEGISLIDDLIGKEKDFVDITTVFEYAYYEVCSQYESVDGEIIRYDLDTCFNSFIDYLDQNNIFYSISNKTILVSGLKIKLMGEEVEPEIYNGKIKINHNHKMIINISIINFIENYNMLDTLLKVTNIIKLSYLWLYFNPMFSCVKNDIQLSSLIAKTQAMFKHNKNSIGSFYYKDSISFKFVSSSRGNVIVNNNFVLAVTNEIKPISIMNLVNDLYKIGVIKKS